MPDYSRRFKLYSLDRSVLMLMAGLLVAIALILISGDHAEARVRDFSWHDRKIGAENIAFTMTFSRPMDPNSVESNLEITPPLPGKFSWAGRRMAYTLAVPAPYGELFQVRLNQAQDKFSADSGGEAGRFEAFESQFQTRRRAFAYIGSDGEEANRLVLNDLTTGTRQVLTPPDLVVLSFEPYPLGDLILISAVNAVEYEQGNLEPQLYTVTTGIPANPPQDFSSSTDNNQSWLQLFDQAVPPPGELTLVLDNQGYQNLKFDLAASGEAIVVQRVNLENPTDFGPWLIQGDQVRPLDTEPGGDFLITPDSQTLLLLQGEGTAIIPLDDNESEASDQPLDFLPEYGRVFDLTTDGTAAAMVNFNQDDPEQRYTESLFLVDNQGNETPLMQASGTVLDAQFAPSNRLLYTLTTEVLPGEAYIEQPILSAIDLKTETITDLLLLPPQQNITMSLSPDGLALLLNLSALQEADTPNSQSAPSQQVWLLPLFNTTEERLAGIPAQNQPEQLPSTGTAAAWLP